MQVHGSQSFVGLGDLTESEAPQERPGGLRRWNREASERFLGAVGTRDREVIETCRSERDLASDIPARNCPSVRPRARFLRRRWSSTAVPRPTARAAARIRTAPAWAVMSRVVVETRKARWDSVIFT